MSDYEIEVEIQIFKFYYYYYFLPTDNSLKCIQTHSILLYLKREILPYQVLREILKYI